ncbi:hypothetical protein GCM10027280_49580 [Micromonospora polyrhachis]|uniref:Uncharacterized protein n=1 Tax=Micromonospora polyrhachis TaxID=1282883 RepID=A0A7W7WQW9_9ACTN|nr:hypothetical protein [Micromonospora polyrhachis]MBB4960706.1 hypothetical protein [Micromonospora polyrhachis]
MTDPYSPYSNQPDPNQPQQWGPPPTSAPPGQSAGYPAPAQPGAQPQYGQPAQPGQYDPTGQQPQYGTPGQPGQYDPTGAQPQYGQPAQPGQYDPTGQQPQYGTPGQPGAYDPSGQPPYGTPEPPKKSNKGLTIGLIIGGVVLLVLLLCGGAVALVMNSGDDEDDKPIAQPGNSAGADPSNGAKPTQPGNKNNNAITADSASDFREVCSGGAIMNAAPYNGPAGAKAYAFSNSPGRLTSWGTESLDYDATYYAKSAEYTTVSVVGCLTYEEGSEASGQKCDIKASDGTKLTVDYMSSRYTLTFHNAQTGEKIGDGGSINAPATRCPSFMTYNKTTLKSYASPDDGTLNAAFKKFLS